MTTTEQDKCRVEFEKHFEIISSPPHPPTLDGDGYLEKRSWAIWKAAWQAAYRTRPTITEQEAITRVRHKFDTVGAFIPDAFIKQVVRALKEEGLL